LRPRHIAAVALGLGLTVADFVVARVLAERDARHQSEGRVAIADAQILSRVEDATSLTASLSRFVSDESATGVTNHQFTRNALRWLSPPGLPAAAWAQEVQAADRTAYERRIGRPIVAPDERHKPVRPGSSDLPATLVCGGSPAVPKEPVSGRGAVLPWIIPAGGRLLATLAGALAVIAARLARAQQDFDRIFNLSPNLVAVANFDGHFTRVNPAAEQVLGYTQEELLARPYLDFVHPHDRESTAAEAAAIGQRKTTLSFHNRFLRKDGSLRILEWPAMPVIQDVVMYGVARG
jgi:PAS domain S-box-containing protein